MATSKRVTILNNIKTILENVSGINYVEIDRATPPDWETQVLPAAFIYQGEEVRDDSNSTIGNETWNWEIFIEVIANDTDLETLLQNIHNDMYADYTLSSIVLNSYRTGSTFYYIDPESRLKSMILAYTVRYDHAQGAL
jgi:hypothetical protein